jgi:hypothetical protein
MNNRRQQLRHTWQGPSFLSAVATLPLANAPCALQFEAVHGAGQPCPLRVAGSG